MPKLPRNLVKRGRTFQFRQVVNGRMVRRSLGPDYQEACRRLRSLKTDSPPLNRITLEEAADRWLKSYVPTVRGEKGQKLAAQRVRDYINPFAGHLLLGRLSAGDCRALRLWLEKKTLSIQSVRHILSDVRCLLNWCEDSGLIDRSPFPRRILPKIQERPPDRLNDEEVGKVCSLPKPYGFVCRFLVQTGLRWGEAIRSQTSDIQSGGVLVIHQTKSGKVRRIPLAPELRNELRNRVGRIVPFKIACSFARQVRERAGIPGFHVHQLRHSFACRWLEAGGSLAALQDLLGHSSIVVTQRYGRLGEVHVQAEAERIQGRMVTEVVTAALK